MITWEEIRDIIQDEVYIGSGSVLGITDASKAIVARLEAAQQSVQADGLTAAQKSEVEQIVRKLITGKA